MNEYQMTYMVTLDALNANTALFRTPNGVIVEIPREGWERMGRPAEFVFTPMDPKTYFEGRLDGGEELLVD